jgi:hypothetical protein
MTALAGSGWLALYAGLVLSQTGHLAEHVAQMVQIHGLGIAAPQAHGVVGNLDLEWVHFIWNVGILGGLGAVLHRLPRNIWSWLAFGAAAWHSVEHTVILAAYLSTGVPGDPGLLAEGGAVLGGGPLARPDLHFIYNLAEAAFLAAGFAASRRMAVAVSGQPAVVGSPVAAGASHSSAASAASSTVSRPPAARRRSTSSAPRDPVSRRRSSARRVASSP